MTTRRRFLAMSAATGGTLGLGLTPRAEDAKPLRILILGGTGFIGPHMVRRALSRGHQITLFNRGRTNNDLFPEVDKLVGDRDGKLDALTSGTWDAVIDNSGYVPRHVRDSAQLLAERADQYLFISSVSAYANFERRNIGEDYRLGVLPDPSVEEVTGETYGPLKALCEHAVSEAFGDQATVVRPGYIVGPGDSTDRWTYWPMRVAAGGTMLVPGTPNDRVQFIDARDLAAFVINLLETGTHGTFNGVGPARAMTMGRMLAEMQDAIGTDTRLTWADTDFLLENNVLFPIWSPPSGDTAGLHYVSNERSLAAGLTTRPVADITTATLTWWKQQSQARQDAMRSGLRVPPELAFGPAPLARQMAAEQRLLDLLAQRNG